MSLLKAFGKAILRAGNDYMFDKNKNRAKQKAFKNVGDMMNNARKSGSYINGSLAYHKELRAQTLKAKRKHINLDRFIGDL